MKCTAQDTSRWTTSCEQCPHGLPIACIVYPGSTNPSQYWTFDPTVHTPVFTVTTLKELVSQLLSFCLYQLYHACVPDYQRAQTPEPMLQPVKPSRPWEVVSADIFSYNGKDYLVIVDHFSGFFEMDHLHTMTSQSVINKLRPHFAWHGSPTKFLMDNAHQLVSDEFEALLQACHLIAVLAQRQQNGWSYGQNCKVPSEKSERFKLWYPLCSACLPKYTQAWYWPVACSTLSDVTPKNITAYQHCTTGIQNHQTTHLRKWSNARNALKWTMVPTPRR